MSRLKVLNVNEFIDIYEEKRRNGSSEIEAYTYASGKLAFHSDRDFDLLQDLYFHFVDDLRENVFGELEELKDEFTT